MPHCLAPSNDDIFSINGICGRPIISNSELYLCDYHYSILKKSPDNPTKSFHSTVKCMICNYRNKNNYKYHKYGICDGCMSLEDSKHITLTKLLKIYSYNPELYYKSNYKVKLLFKHLLSEIDELLPYNFTIIITNNTIKIMNKKFKLIRIIKYDSNYNISIYSEKGLISVIN